MTRGDKAYENFLKGYNCAQAVAVTYCDVLGLDEETAARLASGFGGGMGRMREVCGAFSGAVMVMSAVYGYSDPKNGAEKTELYENIRALADSFRAETGSIICKELLGLKEMEKSPSPEARTEQYYKKRPCPELCRLSGNLLERFISEHPPKNQQP